MVAANGRQIICHGRELVERGRGIRFEVARRGELVPAFVVRFEGKVHAYLNRCAHRSLELDWNAGDFFDAFAVHLLCATHGARYAPGTGICVGGPCTGARLVKLAVVEDEGNVYLDSGDDIHLEKTDVMT